MEGKGRGRGLIPSLGDPMLLPPSSPLQTESSIFGHDGPLVHVLITWGGTRKCAMRHGESVTRGTTICLMRTSTHELGMTWGSPWKSTSVCQLPWSEDTSEKASRSC